MTSLNDLSYVPNRSLSARKSPRSSIFPHKLRMFLLDRRTHTPAPGIPVSLHLVVRAGDKTASVQVGALISDHVGYVSFDLHGPPILDRPSIQVVRVVVDPDRKSTRLNSSHLVISYAVF